MSNNLILIGMPGSGKSTLGKELGRQLQRDFIDIDHEIENYTGQSIPQLFEISENHFRNIESQVTLEVAKSHKAVISTGGGVVLREENMRALKESGIVIFINRPIEMIAQDLVMDTRPLFKEEGLKRLKELYDSRIGLYLKYADCEVKNGVSALETIQEIMRCFQEGKR